MYLRVLTHNIALALMWVFYRAILNAFFAIESVPLNYAPAPVLELPLQDRENMLERVREAKSQLLPRGVATTREAYRRTESSPLSFRLDEEELADVVAVINAVLLEARKDPKNMVPLVGASVNDVALLLEELKSSSG